MDPALSMIRQPTEDLGRSAARLLLDRLNGFDGSTRVVELQSERIDRASVAPPNQT
jgi:LacI family transcriptional regulator